MTVASHTHLFRPHTLIVALLLLLCPFVAHAFTYVTCTESRYTVADLERIGAIGEHLQLSSNTSFIITSDCYLREICGYDGSNVYDVEIVLADGATLTVDQGAGNLPGISAANITVSGDGKLLVTGKDCALNLKGGQLLIEKTEVELVARSRRGQAVVGENQSEMRVVDSELSISSMNSALAGNFASFAVAGERSKVTIGGSVGAGNGNQPAEFIVEGGEVSVTGSCGTAIYATNVTIKNAKLFVNQYGDDSGAAGINSALLQADNSTIVVHASGNGLRCEQASFNDCFVEIHGGNSAYGIIAETEITMTGHGAQSRAFVTAGAGALLSNQDITIANAYLNARAGDSASSAVKAVGSIRVEMRSDVLYEAHSLVEPFSADGGIYLTGHTQITGVVPGDSCASPGKCVEGNTHFMSVGGAAFQEYVKLQQLHIRDITGETDTRLLQATTMRHSRPGNEITFDFSPLEPYAPSDKPELTVTLYRAPNDDLLNRQPVLTRQVTDFALQRVLDEQDVGYTYWCEVSIAGYRGTLRSLSYRILQQANTSMPVKPTISVRSNNFILSNAKNDQEYIVIAQDKWEAFQLSPDESWWQNSLKPSNNSLMLLTNWGVRNSVNYVVTRFRETVSSKAGTQKVYSVLYYGDSDVAQGIILSAAPVMGATLNNEPDGAINVAQDRVLRIEAQPIPANAENFEGAPGIDWRTDSVAEGDEPPFMLFADVRCHVPLVDTVRYTTVYARAQHPGCGWTIRAAITDSTTLKRMTALLKFNIGDDRGHFEPQSGSAEGAPVKMPPTGVVEGIPITFYPSVAALGRAVTVAVTGADDNGGPLPVVMVHRDKPIIDVQTQNLPVGAVYDCSLFADGNLFGSFPIIIDQPELRALSIGQAEYYVSPGERLRLELDADVADAALSGDWLWTSDDERVVRPLNPATDASFVIDENAVPGSEAVVTLQINGVTMASCRFRVMGKVYDLWVAGKQVNSFNQHDVMGDGLVSYAGGATGGTLTLRGTEIHNPTGRPGIVSDIPNLSVNLRTPVVTVSGGSQFNGANTYLTGGGFFKTSAAGSVAAFSGASVTVADSVTLRAWASAPAVDVTNLLVQGDSACVQAYSYDHASMLVSTGLFGTITLPSEAVFNPVDGWVAVSADNLDSSVTNAYVYVMGEGAELFQPQGDVNADGVVNVSDITTLVNMILGVITVDSKSADINRDGKVNVSDVTALINLILG